MVRRAGACGRGRVRMPIDTERHHRRSIRLQGYDYSQNGAYFLTLCVYQRVCLFGDVVDGEMQLSELGEIVQEELLRTPLIRTHVELDAFVVMPNHFHAIVMFVDDAQPVVSANVGAHSCAPLQKPTTLQRTPRSLGSLVAGFKSVVTKRVNEQREQSCARLWQRNYYEHVIRNESSLNDIRSYIQTNPARWTEDTENPAYISR